MSEPTCGRCGVYWCDFVDAALLDAKRGDWECACDVPLPFGVREPEGRCYCPPPADLPTKTAEAPQ